eukprot:1447396-Karenia_brevis.AAC.1
METPRDASVVNVAMTNLPGAGLWPLKDWKVHLLMLTGDVVYPHEDSWCMSDDYPLQFCETQCCSFRMPYEEYHHQGQLNMHNSHRYRSTT